ncbi:hypothetical protein NDU88_000429 [Pleurodeles waltl]|uniref:Uncharacterized protein n=1 Tax=Pleurodeles waltl TaxID=8319 RepID=A0AAV7VTG6_PLEWA|nr:hypothetical protein NDU88_000429 [Pleurodeles waltl]
MCQRQFWAYISCAPAPSPTVAPPPVPATFVPLPERLLREFQAPQQGAPLQSQGSPQPCAILPTIAPLTVLESACWFYAWIGSAAPHRKWGPPASSRVVCCYAAPMGLLARSALSTPSCLLGRIVLEERFGPLRSCGGKCAPDGSVSVRQLFPPRCR